MASGTVTKCLHACTSGRCAAWISWGEAAPFQLEKHAQTAHIAHRGEPSCPCPHWVGGIPVVQQVSTYVV